MPARVSTSTGATVARRTANDFDFGAVLGEGSYSTVYAVTDRIDPSRQYALKVLDKRHIVKVRGPPCFTMAAVEPQTDLVGPSILRKRSRNT